MEPKKLMQLQYVPRSLEKIKSLEKTKRRPKDSATAVKHGKRPIAWKCHVRGLAVDGVMPSQQLESTFVAGHPDCQEQMDSQDAQLHHILHNLTTSSTTENCSMGDLPVTTREHREFHTGRRYPYITMCLCVSLCV